MIKWSKSNTNQTLPRKSI